MADAVTVDTLAIEIEASSEDAAKHIRALADSLKTLKSALGGKNGNSLATVAKDLKSLNDPDVEKTVKTLKDLSDALGSLKSAGKVNLSKVVPDGLGTKLKEITESVNGISDEAIGKFDRLTSSLEKLSGVDLKGVGSATKAASKVTDSATKTAGEENDGVAVDVDTSAAEGKLKKLRDSLGNLKAAFKQKFTAEGLKAGFNEVSAKIDSVRTKALSLAKVKIGEMFTAPIKQVESFREKLDRLGSAFKRVLFYRAVRTLIKGIGDAMKEGVNNVYQYSSALGGTFAQSMNSAASSVQYFKNSIGAAMAPLLNAIIPVLNAIIDKVVQVINVINQLFALISGAKFWTKAVKQSKEYASAVGGAGSAAKEALKYLAPFDELNVLPDDNSGGGGGGGGGADYGSMFEEVPVELGGRLGEIFDVFQKAWENEGQNTIQHIRDAFNELKELGKTIGDSIFEVWTNGTGQKILETQLRTYQNIADIVGGLARKIREAWKENDNGTKIVQHILDMYLDWWKFQERITKSTADWVDTLDLTPLMTSLEGLGGSLEHLWSSLLELAGNLFEGIVLPALKWIIETALPWLIEKISRVVEIFASFIDVLNGDKSVSDFFGELSTGEAIVVTLAVVFGGLWLAISIGSGIVSLVSGAIYFLAGAFGFLLSPIGAVIVIIGAAVAAGVWLYKNWDEVGQKLSDTWEKIRGVAEKVWGAISGFFKGNFKQTKSDAETIWGGTSSTLKTKWNGSKKDSKSIWSNISKNIKGEWKTEQKDADSIWSHTSASLTGLWKGSQKDADSIWTGTSKTIKEKWDATKKEADPTWTSISKTIKDKWDETKKEADPTWTSVYKTLKGKWGDTKTEADKTWPKITSTIKGEWGKVKTDADTSWGQISTSLNGKWSSLSTDVSKPFSTITTTISGAWSDIASGVSSAWSTITSTLYGHVKTALGYIEDFVNNSIRGINAVITGINNASTASGKSGNAKLVKGGYSLLPKADGGFVDAGQIFLANEAGPELVGRIGSHTAVANQMQIIEGITAGVEEGNEGVIAVLYQILNVAREIEKGNGNGGALDMDALARGVTKYQRRQARAAGV